MRELSLHILDVIQNSIAAGADLIKTSVNEDINNDLLVIKIIDNGQGMNEDIQDRVMDPFVTSRKTREVGLGLPLLREAARRCDGEMEITSYPGDGTAISVEFKYDHIDRAPLGDITGTMVNVIALNPDLNFIYQHIVNEREFMFKTGDIKAELDDVRINHPRIINWIEDYLGEAIKDLRGGE